VVIVAWNPIWPINWHHWIGWLIAQYAAATVFIVVGILIKIPVEDARSARTQQNRKR
jgi:hypothetical protein